MENNQKKRVGACVCVCVCVCVLYSEYKLNKQGDNI